MCTHCPDMPLLPGLTFNKNLGKTKFNGNSQFQNIDGICMLKEKVKPKQFGDAVTEKYPSIYARGEVAELPPWIVFNKESLAFDAYFKETLVEFSQTCPYLVRYVKIYFFLEDGTILVREPRTKNSGIYQGTMIARHRIRLPAPNDDNFYDIIDLNVGKEVEFYGKILKIINCDKFTRYFLNRCGISVPDPIPPPTDPYLEERYKKEHPPKRESFRDPFGFKKFIENDKKILKFNGYWDDRQTEFGYLHELEVLFNLADDTLEISEVRDEGCGKKTKFVFLKKTKVPKIYTGLLSPGANISESLLNVFGSGKKSRMVVDRLGCGLERQEYYQDRDLAIGGIVNCFGRKIVLTDLDEFTKKYYKSKYGIDSFQPLSIPKDKVQSVNTDIKSRILPPWNGYGSFQDSAQNCRTVDLKPTPMKDFKKFLKYDKQGQDSYCLRYGAYMVSKIPDNNSRRFIISYFLGDETIQITEQRNSGFVQAPKKFLRRTVIYLPGQDPLKMSDPPLHYLPQHLYVGALLELNSFIFQLTDVDEYALRYMELNAHEFPKSNIKVIMDKIREKLRPIYKDFVNEFLPKQSTAIPYEKLKNKLLELLGEDNFTEHEMITISRAFPGECYPPNMLDRSELRALALTELKKNLWDDLERVHEYFRHFDDQLNGKLSYDDCYTVMRACRIPLDRELIKKILDVMKKDENCCVFYEDILEYLDFRKCPMTDVIPTNVKRVIDWEITKLYRPIEFIDWCAFNKYLDLESVFEQ